MAIDSPTTKQALFTDHYSELPGEAGCLNALSCSDKRVTHMLNSHWHQKCSIAYEAGANFFPNCLSLTKSTQQCLSQNACLFFYYTCICIDCKMRNASKVTI